MIAGRLLSQLHRVRKSGPSSWSACCPAHEDRSPSLAIREADDGRLLLHCFGGCSVDSVLGSLGMDMSDLFPPRENTPGAGTKRERKPWRAADLLHLAAYEATAAVLVASDIAAGRDVSPEDRARLVEATARLCDITQAINV